MYSEYQWWLKCMTITNSFLVLVCHSERRMLLIFFVLLKICYKDCFTCLTLNRKYITRFGSTGTVRNKGERIVSWREPQPPWAIPTHSFLSRPLLALAGSGVILGEISSLGIKTNELCAMKGRHSRETCQPHSVPSSSPRTLDLISERAGLFSTLPLIFFFKFFFKQYLNIFSLLNYHLDNTKKVKFHLDTPISPEITTLFFGVYP